MQIKFSESQNHKNYVCFRKLPSLNEKKWQKYREQLTVKVKHATVLATDRPFLVNVNGPNFVIVYA